MNIQDNTLVLNRLELIETIQNSPEKSVITKAIEKALLDIVYKQRYFNEDDYYCILNRLKWVLKNNAPFREKMNLSKARFNDFWVWPDLWPFGNSFTKRLDKYLIALRNGL